MNDKITITKHNNEKVECDVLIEFEYDNNKYIVYTDNTYNKDDQFNLYKAKVDANRLLSDPIDIDVMPIFDKLILDYKEKIKKGEL